jgi:deoxyribonuclease-4
VVNHVEGTIPVINLAHVHARGHGRLRTSEDYGELFDQVRETIGTKQFYCHFSGVEHRMGNAMHYTQIKKSDLNFEPLAEFIIEEGAWLDMTLISDSPLLEHDAMYMVQNIERARHRQLERKAREDRRKALAAQANISPEEMEAREVEIAAARAKDALAKVQPVKATKTVAEPAKEEETVAEPAKEEKKVTDEKKGAAKAKKSAAKKDDNDDLFVTEDDDDDLF